MTYQEQMQEIYRCYRREKNVPSEEGIDLHAVFEWAFENGLWKPKQSDIASQFMREMRSSLRQESTVNERGERIRINFAVQKRKEGKQLSLWGGVDMPFEDLERSCQQRRIGIVNVCRQLNNDVDNINAIKKPKNPIQIIWDFCDDILEAQEAKTSA